jgi:hypothetical protein
LPGLHGFAGKIVIFFTEYRMIFYIHVL